MVFNEKYIIELLEKNRYGLVIQLIKKYHHIWSIDNMNFLGNCCATRYADRYIIFYYILEYVKITSNRYLFRMENIIPPTYNSELVYGRGVKYAKYIDRHDEFIKDDKDYRTEMCEYSRNHYDTIKYIVSNISRCNISQYTMTHMVSSIKIFKYVTSHDVINRYNEILKISFYKNGEYMSENVFNYVMEDSDIFSYMPKIRYNKEKNKHRKVYKEMKNMWTVI